MNPRRSKFGNKKTEFGGMLFDSKREAARWGELLMLEKVGEISMLRRQVAYELAPSVRFKQATRAKPALRYVVDFEYLENGQRICEDVKGVETEGFNIKRHLMLSVHGIDVRVTR